MRIAVEAVEGGVSGGGCQVPRLSRHGTILPLQGQEFPLPSLDREESHWFHVAGTILEIPGVESNALAGTTERGPESCASSCVLYRHYPRCSQSVWSGEWMRKDFTQET